MNLSGMDAQELLFHAIRRVGRLDPEMSAVDIERRLARATKFAEEVEDPEHFLGTVFWACHEEGRDVFAEAVPRRLIRWDAPSEVPDPPEGFRLFPTRPVPDEIRECAVYTSKGWKVGEILSRGADFPVAIPVEQFASYIAKPRNPERDALWDAVREISPASVAGSLFADFLFAMKRIERDRGGDCPSGK